MYKRTLSEKIADTLTESKINLIYPLVLLIPMIGGGIGYVVADKPVYEGKIANYHEYRVYQSHNYGDRPKFTPTMWRVTVVKSTINYEVQVITSSKINDYGKLKVKEIETKGTKIINQKKVINVLKQVDDKMNLQVWALLALANNSLANQAIKSNAEPIYDVQAECTGAVAQCTKGNESAMKYKITFKLYQDNQSKERTTYTFTYNNDQLIKNGIKYIL